MAQYKVPQDVEADDKLLGPFSFRQFVYLLICGGLIAIAVGLFQVFPMLAIIPIPFILFFAALALPLKKDQPMETYLVALISYYIKPRIRRWTPGQKESTIQITVPKVVEASRTRDISGEEATHRLSFLADIVDTEGRAIKEVGSSPIRDDLIAEANATNDMFETQHFSNLGDAIAKDENSRHEEVMREMQEAIDRNSNFGGEVIARNVEEMERAKMQQKVQDLAPGYKEEVLNSSAVVTPDIELAQPVENRPTAVQNNEQKNETNPVKSSIIELANNPDYSVATIAKEANRINGKEEGEVFISLH